MLQGFKDLNFPADYEYSSDGKNLPIEFYLTVFPIAKTIDLKLGYFSSNAIKLLAYGFARFLYNGGKLRIITNHYLYNADKELLDNKPFDNTILDLSNLEELKESLTKNDEHFFDCLKFLINKGRLEIVPVMLKPGNMAHYKQGVFTDFFGDKIFADGSCNFTGAGLIENGESISIFRSWGSGYEKRKINSKEPEIQSILSKENEKYKYLSIDDIKNAIQSIGKDKSVDILLSESPVVKNESIQYNQKIKKLISEERETIREQIISINENPRFPFNSEPRAYQKEAYQKWLSNNYSGLFAMATGTGKTITSLNCLLNLWIEYETYQAVILVPSKALVTQWKKECNLFNFKKIIEVSSSNNFWQRELNTLSASLIFSPNTDFIVIATYRSFESERFQKIFKKFPKTTLLIADEAHNIASPSIIPIIKELHLERRIALSATPNRRFDPEGNSTIEEVFNTKPPYTYSYSMRQAIDNGFLCQYIYHPYIAYLNEFELKEYKEITSKLVKFFDAEKQNFSDNSLVSRLLIQRKSVIHKAASKLEVFRSILCDIQKTHKKLNNALVYVPEGVDENNHQIMDNFLSVYEKQIPNSRAISYTGETPNRDVILDHFENGIYESIFSMKCLDEGIDIPRAEIAIFCSSTGNPRQFIQRRGRVLRNHSNKRRAYIYDLIVLPSKSSLGENRALEQKLVKDEMVRVIYFASLANNYYDTMKKLEPLCENYDLNIYALQRELEEDDGL